MLDDEPPPFPGGGQQTIHFDDEAPAVPPPSQTRRLEDDQPELPVELPEFSTLDKVLKSFDFEPLADEDVTPSVEEEDEDSARPDTIPEAESETFDEILSAIDSNQPSAPSKSKSRSDFDDLVESMRVREPHKPLPERQQNSLDFIVTSGMDQVLKEIEHAKTKPLNENKPESRRSSQEDETAFQKLAQEEPPMPALEESGTVSDLMTGIGDTGFRNVLAMLRGEEAEEGQAVAEQSGSQENGDDFAAFAEREEAREETDDQEPTSAAPRPRDAASDWWAYDDSEDDSSEEESVAHVVLAAALDSSLPESLPLADVMNEIENRLAAHRHTIKPLPSWDMDTGAFRSISETGVTEPDFLPESLPPGEFVLPPSEAPELPPSDASSRTTQPSAALQETFEPPNPEMDTEVEAAYLEETALSKAVREPEPDTTQPESAGEPEWSSAETENWAGEPAQEPISADVQDEWPDVEPQPADEATASDDAEASASYDAEWPIENEAADHSEDRFEAAEPHDPYIAQLALNLTHASLELTAEGTLLSRDGEVVAAAGHLAPEDTAELLQAIASDPETSEGARFRFISLPSSGKDYMLYSIQTTGGLMLSMVFAGATPLRVIRKQAQRLVEALESVPETAIEEAVTAAVEETAPEPAVVPVPDATSAVMSTYAGVWLLRDPDEHLNDAVAQTIIAGLSIQLQEQNWRIHTLQVHEDFVYLLADVPGERPPHEIIRELKRRSADMAHAQNPDLTPQMLWADSYLILTPGRELQTEEILEFINFQRML
jgi:REP element-mobilizing transposase RayT